MKTNDLIDRQAALDTEGLEEEIRCEMCKNPMHTDRGCDGNCKYDQNLYKRITQILDKRIMPLLTAQQEITDEQAIDHLQATGWMQNHDREMYEMGIKEQLKNAEPGRCNNCRYNLKLEKYDYSQGGCQHSDYDGFACMAFASEGTAVHMVGVNPDEGRCECWKGDEGQ